MKQKYGSVLQNRKRKADDDVMNLLETPKSKRQMVHFCDFLVLCLRPAARL